jgi:hypothetical protein
MYSKTLRVMPKINHLPVYSIVFTALKNKIY